MKDMRFRTLISLVVAAALLAGCGRRGPLEAPGSVEPAPLGDNLLVGPLSPGAQDPSGTAPGPTPDRPFFLDPLI